jgi:hypothetical protein
MSKIVDLTDYREKREEELDAWDVVIKVDDDDDETEPKQFSVAEIQDMLEPAEFEVVIGWLSEGKRVAIFQNHALSHSDLGRLKLESFLGQARERPFDGTHDESCYRPVGVCQP